MVANIFLATFLTLLSAAAIGGEKGEPSARHHSKGSRSHGTQIKMAGLHSALEHFRERCGSYPKNNQGGLRALYIVPADVHCIDYEPLDQKDTELLKDAWENEFIYDCKDGKHFTLRSLGADKKPGGRRENGDIINDERDRKVID